VLLPPVGASPRHRQATITRRPFSNVGTGRISEDPLSERAAQPVWESRAAAKEERRVHFCRPASFRSESKLNVHAKSPARDAPDDRDYRTTRI